jgi:release factor glutamine methyltransferase
MQPDQVHPALPQPEGAEPDRAESGHTKPGRREPQSPPRDRARLDAERLLLHVLCPGKNQAWLMTHLEEELPDTEAARYSNLIERRSQGEPIQYITGETEFYGLPFRVTPAALIPRPETEDLVEKVIELAAQFENPRIVDIGTGSGAIAVALAHELAKLAAGRSVPAKASGLNSEGMGFSPYIEPGKLVGALVLEGDFPENPSENPAFLVTAIDISSRALKIAEKNARRNGVSIRFLEGDLLAPVAGERFEIVVSNPPYVPSGDLATLPVEVRDYEPALALFAGEDGLAVYRRLIPAAFEALTPGGFVALEIGFGQSAAMAALLTGSGFEQIEFVPDLQGIPRVACARRP